ncbi:MAG: hypothetical protein H7X99_10580 [Saprospiraceae bacterium]|nr:hypothetical protein [Saprospiraceae bacterium]
MKYIYLIFAVILTIYACKSIKHYKFRELYQSHNELIHGTASLTEKPFLKIHLKNGGVCIMDDKWNYDSLTHHVEGQGKMYDFKRQELQQDVFHISIDSVQVFETNTKLKPEGSIRMLTITILTAMDVALGIGCLFAPKACFGSCPTFYIHEDNGQRLADAESFSNAILPSLAYVDIDDIRYEATSGQKLNIKMKNEALETHVVKKANLVLIPKTKNQDVFISPDDKYYITEGQSKLLSATTMDGDITHLLEKQDGMERFSLADKKDLVSAESIILDFDISNHTKLKGLKLSYRQTMMTTYCLYSALGYMGDEVGDIFSKIESDAKASEKMKSIFHDALGGISIYVYNDVTKQWVYEGEIYETGPIAFNHEILPLKTKYLNDRIKIKLVLNKGLWRIDHVALYDIVKEGEPVCVPPYQLTKNGVINANDLASVIESDNSNIISMPGDVYGLAYSIPDDKESNRTFKIFLETEGYYLEWMRKSWLKDKNLPALQHMMKDPKSWLTSETSNYKKYEHDMENQFWNSRWTNEHKSYESL